MIERAFDYRRVNRLAKANQIDANTDWKLTISRKVFYLIEVQGGNDMGVWCFEPENDGVYSMHVAMSPEWRGRKAIDSGLDAIKWLYQNTNADNIIAPVPEYLKHAQRIPRGAGLVYRGIEHGRKIYEMNRNLFKKLEVLQ